MSGAQQFKAAVTERSGP